MLLAFASAEVSGVSPKRVSISLRIEVVSYSVWSTKPRLAKGDTMMAGTRVPGPQRSRVAILLAGCLRMPSSLGVAGHSPGTPLMDWPTMPIQG